MTTTTYEVQLDGDLTVRVENAEYYKREEGWVTFKDSEHKVITDFPQDRIRLIARLRQVEQSTAINAAKICADDIAVAASKRAFYGRR